MPDTIDYDALAAQHGGNVALPAALSRDDQAFLASLTPDRRAMIEPLYRLESQTQSGAYSPAPAVPVPVAATPAQDAPQATQAAPPALDYDALAAQHGGVQAQKPVGQVAAGSTWAEKLANAEKMITGWDQKLTGAEGDVGLGAIKGLGQTATNLGSLVHKIPGVDTAIDALYNKPGLSRSAFAAANQALAPTDAAQSIGKGAEQAGETFLPSGAAADAAKGLSLAGRVALEGGVNAGIAAAQGGNPLVAGALGATLPAAGALIGKAVPALDAQADKGVMEFLGPTKERFKAMAERLTPEILKRGLSGSRETLQAQAANAVADTGNQIDQAIQQYGDRPVGTQPIIASLEEAKNAFRTVTQQHVSTVNPSSGAKVLSVTPDGTADVLHEFEPRAIGQLDSLQKVIAGLGPDVRADQLIAIRRTWDKVVDQAGGFSHRAGGAIGVPLADATEAAAKREATSAIRDELDKAVPELSSLNKEFSFWKGLDSVLSQTMQRTQPQKPGLLQMGAEAAGNVVGGIAGATHGPAGAVGGAAVAGKASKALSMLFGSPRWKLASAQAKDNLASAITSGNQGDIMLAIGRITATQGSKVGQ